MIFQDSTPLRDESALQNQGCAGGASIIHKIKATVEERNTMIVKALEEVKLTPPDDFMGRWPHMLSAVKAASRNGKNSDNST